ncbi:MAG: ABC transporter ATP-binding protein [Syntrophobacteraceae bacterium]
MLLETRGLRKSFGGLMAVLDVDLQVDHKEIVSIIGPNGAGKSTLFNLITGHIPVDRGEVYFKGRDITRLAPYEISRLGIGRSFQKLNIFPRLSAFQNIQVALFSGKGLNRRLFSSAENSLSGEVEEILESVGLADRSGAPGGLLAHGDQKRLELGIVLALNPELLLLDEPTQGMSAGETSQTTELIYSLVKKRKMSLAFVEHDMKVVFGISDRIYVMHQGTMIFCGNPEEVKSNEEVRSIYLGKGKRRVA